MVSQLFGVSFMSTTTKSRQLRRKGRKAITGYRQIDLSPVAIMARLHTHTAYIPGAIAHRLPSAGELRAKGISVMRKWGDK